jgi:membrane protease YdiL (CAAX protease family)
LTDAGLPVDGLSHGGAGDASPDPEADTPPPVTDLPAGPDGVPAEPDGPPLDADGQPRLTPFGLAGRAVPAVYLVAWIASLVGVGAMAVSIMGSQNPFARWLFVVGLVFLGVGLLAAAGSQATERGRRRSLPFRGPSPVLAFAAVVVVTLLASLVALAPLGALGVDPGGPLGTAVSLGVTTVVFVGVVRVLVVGTGSLTWAEMGFSRQPAGIAADLGTGALLAVPVVVVELLLVSVMVSFVGTPASPLPPATSIGALVLNLLSAAILAPLGEEVFFRGYTTTAWARAVGARGAIVRGALFFSFAHITTLFATSFQTGLAAAVSQYVALLPAGLALGWVFLQRRSIWAAFALHGAYNALIVLLAFAATAGRA